MQPATRTATPGRTTTTNTTTMGTDLMGTHPIGTPWWKQGVVYQIYPRSFQDSNGDGTGDLQGVIDRLDHLQALGVTIVWLTPFFTSPHDDGGYDITNLDDVDPRYGDLATFDRLVAACHARGIRIVLDAVMNHTSDRHPWFIESRASRDSAKRDWYFWRPPRDGREPNNWAAGFAPSAWAWDARTGEYYLHYYTPSMPDLNWDHPPVREALYAMLRRWLDRGVDGFRLDSINLIKKDTHFPDATQPDPASPGYGYDPAQIYNQPGLLEHLQDMNREVFAGRDVMTVGETSVTPAEVALQFVRPQARALDMVFNFEPVEMPQWDLVHFKAIQRRWYRVIEQGGWTTQYLSNHDQPRPVSRFGDDRRFRAASAKALATMLHTLPGTPFVYQGEELGLPNVHFDAIEQYDDVATHNAYRGLLKAGKTPAEALAAVQATSRDNARTPMPWSDAPQGGFTAGAPWLPVPQEHVPLNVQAQSADADSVLHHYRNLIALRAAHAVLVQGDFVDLLPEHARLYAYTRSHGGVTWLMLLNLSSEPLHEAVPFEIDGRVLMSSGGQTGDADRRPAPRLLRLAPWQALIIAR
jgi:oligo-1,6-glucosidase